MAPLGVLERIHVHTQCHGACSIYSRCSWVITYCTTCILFRARSPEQGNNPMKHVPLHANGLPHGNHEERIPVDMSQAWGRPRQRLLSFSSPAETRAYCTVLLSTNTTFENTPMLDMPDTGTLGRVGFVSSIECLAHAGLRLGVVVED